MENRFKEEDSLKLISEMINTARGNLRKGAGKYFILWGYIVFITSVISYISFADSIKLGADMASTIWGIALIVGGVFTAFFIIKDFKKIQVKTYIDSIIFAIWAGFGIGAISLAVLLSGTYGAFIYPGILFIYTFALFISSKAYRMKWMLISVLICFACVISYKFISFMYYPLPMAIAILCGNIIPGHILNKLAKKQGYV